MGQYESSGYRSIRERIAANCRELRGANDWTQEEAAHRCGMSVSLYQSVEAARGNATLTTLARLCEGFSVDLVRLCAPAPPPPARTPGRPRKRG